MTTPLDASRLRAACDPATLSFRSTAELSRNGVPISTIFTSSGDSASSAELYALLSSVAAIPLRQDLAVTGSVNQRGEVQAVGGINEKVEGFFDLCRRRGLTGRQGILIPAANVVHLMLREDVVEAVREGRFHVHPVHTVDEGIALLSNRPAGAADAEGCYPAGTFNAAIEGALDANVERLRQAKARTDR